MAILLAGAVLLLQISDADPASPPVSFGQTVMVGDMEVTVQSAVSQGSTLEIAVVLAGVDDPDPSSDFGLVAGGRSYAVSTTDCDPSEVAGRACTLVFDLSTLTVESAPVLVAERGESRTRWVLPRA